MYHLASLPEASTVFWTDLLEYGARKGMLNVSVSASRLRSPSAVEAEGSFNTQGESLHCPFHEPLMSYVGEGLGAVPKG